MGVIPSALEIEDPARKAKVSGQLSVAEGFLPIFVETLDLELSSAQKPSPKDLFVRILGDKGIWKTELDAQGRFSFPPIYAGSYFIELFPKGEKPILRRPIVLHEQSELNIRVEMIS